VIVNIFDLISSETGLIYKKKSSTEYGGPCFMFGCGGTDRMSILPGKDRYICRRCSQSGDSIEFLKQYKNLTYIQACAHLNITPNIQFKSLNTTHEKPGQNEIIWTPRVITYPSLTWQSKAEAFLFESYKFLLSKSGRTYRHWLNNRGISNETIKIARLGWNSNSISFDAEAWGIPLSKNPKNDYTTTYDVSIKQIWLPSGLVIPQFHKGKSVRLRIRQSNPDTANRFILVAGSAMGFFDCDRDIGGNLSNIEINKPWIVVESELDALLLYEQLSDIFRIYAIGNSTSRPDIDTHNYIKDMPGLISLDDDLSGREESKWWEKTYPLCLPYFSEFGKDPGEDFESGIDIRSWGIAGLEKLKEAFPDNNKIAKTNNSEPESFKDAIYQDFNNQKTRIKALSSDLVIGPASVPDLIPPDPPQPKPVSTACIHNQYCGSYKNDICMINNQTVYSDDFLICPHNHSKWYKWVSDSGVITEIILGPGVKKR